MSCQLVNIFPIDQYDALKSTMSQWGPIQDTIIQITGLIPGAPKQWGKFKSEDANWKKVGKVNGRQEPSTPVWTGDVNSNNTQSDILAWIEKVFDPRGRIMICGASRGALNALDLCRKLDADKGFFKIDLTARDRPRGKFQSQNTGELEVFRVRVDLLHLVDVSLDEEPVPRWNEQRKVPKIVRQLAEGYQTSDFGSNPKLWHGPATKMDSTDTWTIRSVNRSSDVPSFSNAHTWVCENETRWSEILGVEELKNTSSLV